MDGFFRNREKAENIISLFSSLDKEDKIRVLSRLTTISKDNPNDGNIMETGI